MIKARRSSARLALCVAAALCAAPYGASAQSGTSAYTKLDLDDCTLLSADQMGAAFECVGHRGTPLFVAEGDLRYNIDVGEADEGWISVAPFNTIGETVEWRYAPNGGDLRAVIIRYYLAGPNGGRGTSELAVITAANEARESCYLAFVPPSAPPSQNEAARDIADRVDELPCIDQRAY